MLRISDLPLGVRKFSSLLPFHVGSGNSPCCRSFGTGGSATGMHFGGFAWRSQDTQRWTRPITSGCENTNGLHKKEKTASTREDVWQPAKEKRGSHTCTRRLSKSPREWWSTILITMGWTTGEQTSEPPRGHRTYATGKNSPNRAVLNIKEFTGERRLANGRFR